MDRVHWRSPRSPHLMGRPRAFSRRRRHGSKSDFRRAQRMCTRNAQGATYFRSAKKRRVPCQHRSLLSFRSRLTAPSADSGEVCACA